MALLAIKGLRTTFDTAQGVVPAVSEADITVDAGEVVGVVGETGCGKTVTALSTMGLIPGRGKATGEILFCGDNLLSKSYDEMCEIRGNEIAMIFQEPMTALNPVLTIGRQICESLIAHRGMNRQDARARAIEMLNLVRVPHAAERMSSYPHQLSGGLCQRVMIAMALVCEPKLIIADEPTTALDVTIQAQILDLLRDLRSRLSTAVLLITHDLGVVAEICDRVYVMYAGRVVESASVFDLFEGPRHPYTAGLLASLPHVEGDGFEDELFSIRGIVPSLLDLPPGCSFMPRCDYASRKCLSLPPLESVGGDGKKHEARCWHPLKRGAMGETR